MCGSCVVVAFAAPVVDDDGNDGSVTSMDQIGIQIETETVHKNSSTASDLVSRDDNIVMVMKGDATADADMLMVGGGGGVGELEDDDNTNIISSSGNYGYGENLLNVNYYE